MSNATVFRLNQLFFALNTVIVGMLVEEMKPSRYLSFLIFGQANLKIAINARFGLHAHSNFGERIAFACFAVFWTALLFLLFQVSSGTTVTRWFFKHIAGLASLVLLPLATFYGLAASGVMIESFNLLSKSIVAELPIALIWGIFYACRRPSSRFWSGFLPLILHFCFWGRLLIGGAHFWLDPFKLIFPAIGAISVYAWGLSLSGENGTGQALNVGVSPRL